MAATDQSTAPAGRPTVGGRLRPATYRDTVEALARAQKTSKGAPAYSRFVNRPLGRRIAAAAFRLGMTPNQVTAISAAWSFAGIAVLALIRPSWPIGLVVAACLVLGYAFDAADGQLARLRGGGSPSGEWLDHMVDATKISSLHLAVLISFYRFVDLPARAFLLVPIGFAVVAAVMFFGMTLNDLLRRTVTARTGRTIERGTTSGLRSLLVVPTDYGLLCVVFLLLGAPVVFAWVYLAIFAANAGFMALAAVKWFTDMKSLSEPGDTSVRSTGTVRGTTT
ncbi:CDP-alcohol phosphatidyltransferase family protein [Nakamurella endophytica]|uniref:CDP-alcohol phosphatidyltransferase n=1 Tax=Nakamurella endophytica TaxID=1748367 RepID=A0A917SNG2_9ACTN|nr:CDP-alcohol phosphatidyltransferase family protein [Nakamurella endophytica]GGL87444.1 CDP-alcohol phosphatidyltransferase [Nakamurella endophytica]